MSKSNPVLSVAVGLLFIAASVPASAGLVSVARIPSGEGFAVFELYDDAALIAECRGMNAWGALAKLEKGATKKGFGTGCWTADINGYVHLFIKSFDDGVVRETKIHNSKFVSRGEDQAPPPDVQKLIKQVDDLDSQCRGGSGDSPKTMAACEKRDKAFDQITQKGWCWGTPEQAGSEKSWGKCQR